MKEALFYRKLDDNEKNAVKCMLCNHYCIIKEGNLGTCKVRLNNNGILYSLTWGKSSGLAIDPIEKKPFFHFKPGSETLSFGTPGCNFSCKNCQNSFLSQDVKYRPTIFNKIPEISPREIAEQAMKLRVDGISYTYSEPTIFFEYARDVILEYREMSKSKDIYHTFVSNGFFSKETLDLIKSENLLNAINIDLKFMNDSKYRQICGAKLEPILDTIRNVAALSDYIHLEVINLVIPDENDSDYDFEELANFIASLSVDIPVHFNRFHPQYKMSDKQPTNISRLLKAREIAKRIGLHYVYIGNAFVEGGQDTYCPTCNSLLISRKGFGVSYNVFSKLKNIRNPKCPYCGQIINLWL